MCGRKSVPCQKRQLVSYIDVNRFHRVATGQSATRPIPAAVDANHASGVQVSGSMIHALVDPIIEGAEERTTPMGLGLRLLVEDISSVFTVRQDTSIHRPRPYHSGIESSIPIPRIWPCTS